mmetsp:Transcript_9382/g.11300  ORF Transcript_9382/g.11300 Transcript_9382/m.11300 type:complete len:713 (+) Transcript_9382:837-2975(+)
MAQKLDALSTSFDLIHQQNIPASSLVTPSVIQVHTASGDGFRLGGFIQVHIQQFIIQRFPSLRIKQLKLDKEAQSVVIPNPAHYLNIDGLNELAKCVLLQTDLYDLILGLVKHRIEQSSSASAQLIASRFRAAGQELTSLQGSYFLFGVTDVECFFGFFPIGAYAVQILLDAMPDTRVVDIHATHTRAFEELSYITPDGLRIDSEAFVSKFKITMAKMLRSAHPLTPADITAIGFNHWFRFSKSVVVPDFVQNEVAGALNACINFTDSASVRDWDYSTFLSTHFNTSSAYRQRLQVDAVLTPTPTPSPTPAPTAPSETPTLPTTTTPPPQVAVVNPSHDAALLDLTLDIEAYSICLNQFLDPPLCCSLRCTNHHFGLSDLSNLTLAARSIGVMRGPNDQLHSLLLAKFKDLSVSHPALVAQAGVFKRRVDEAYSLYRPCPFLHCFSHKYTVGRNGNLSLPVSSCLCGNNGCDNGTCCTGTAASHNRHFAQQHGVLPRSLCTPTEVEYLDANGGTKNTFKGLQLYIPRGKGKGVGKSGGRGGKSDDKGDKSDGKGRARGAVNALSHNQAAENDTQSDIGDNDTVISELSHGTMSPNRPGLAAYGYPQHQPPPTFFHPPYGYPANLPSQHHFPSHMMAPPPLPHPSTVFPAAIPPQLPSTSSASISTSDSQVSISPVLFDGTQVDLANFLRQFPQCSSQDYYRVHLGGTTVSRS